jgi:predicted nucleotidyltransferase
MEALLKQYLAPLRASRLNKILTAFAAEVRENFESKRVDKVVLAGSYALNEGREGSDINLFIFVADDMTETERQKILEIAYNHMKANQFSIVIALSFITSGEYRVMQESESGVYLHISQYGRIIV